MEDAEKDAMALKCRAVTVHVTDERESFATCGALKGMQLEEENGMRE